MSGIDSSIKISICAASLSMILCVLANFLRFQDKEVRLSMFCRDLLERAQLSPLNDTEEGPAWKGLLEKVLRPEPTSKL